MSSDLAYALGALVCYGASDVVYKRAAVIGVLPEQFLSAQALFFCPAVLVFGWCSGMLVWSAGAAWGAAAGVFVLIGFLNYVRSLRSGSVSVIAPVFRLNFLVTAALAILWLGEALTIAKLIGFVLALAAGWLLLAAPSAAPATASAGARPLVQVLVATVAMGAANFCYKLGLIAGATPETLLAAQAVVFTAMINTSCYIATGTMRPVSRVCRHAAAAAFVLLFAFIFLLRSLRHGEASVMVPIAQMGFAIAAIIGLVWLQEAVTMRKLAGLAAAGVALLVLALG